MIQQFFSEFDEENQEFNLSESIKEDNNEAEVSYICWFKKRHNRKPSQQEEKNINTWVNWF
jgi:hypothetical protein